MQVNLVLRPSRITSFKIFIRTVLFSVLALTITTPSYAQNTELKGFWVYVFKPNVDATVIPGGTIPRNFYSRGNPNKKPIPNNLNVRVANDLYLCSESEPDLVEIIRGAPVISRERYFACMKERDLSKLPVSERGPKWNDGTWEVQDTSSYTRLGFLLSGVDNLTRWRDDTVKAMLDDHLEQLRKTVEGMKSDVVKDVLKELQKQSVDAK